MCEQTPVDYKDGDVVWVKLGPCWWPGEVQELSKLPQEWLADFKKPPIAAVKFFDEDAYEYVRSIDKIYSYNCTKKNEFIKKGLDLYRAKNSFMDKFPTDVITAEKRTDGDPNIIDSPLFSPEKKTNFAAILFGTPKVTKKGRKPGGGNKRFSTSSTSSTPSSSSTKVTPNRTITHPRFLGHDDHEVRILVQAPEKKQEMDEEEEVESTYNCTTCGFTTSRIDVIVLHNKSHIQGVYNTPTSTTRRGKKLPVKKGKKVLKMTRSKTSSIVEDLALLEKGIMLSTESSDEENGEELEDDEPKRKRKKNKRKPKKVPLKKEPEVKTDIRVDLLAEWDEDDSEEEEAALNTSAAESDVSVNKIGESLTNNIHEPSVSKVDELNDKTENTKKDFDKSCFDFDEDDESMINEIIGTSVGRKIPRVIPPAEKQKNVLDLDLDEAILPSVVVATDRKESVDPDVEEANLPTAEDDVNRSEHIKEINNVVSGVSDRVSSVAINDVNVIAEDSDKPSSSEEKIEDDEAFNEILESTAVPDLPEIPHSLKFEQNFHNTKTIKFPDKSEIDVTSQETSAKYEDKPEKCEEDVLASKERVATLEERLAAFEANSAASDEEVAATEGRVAAFEESLAAFEERLAVFEGRVAESEEMLTVFEEAITVTEEKVALSQEKTAPPEERVAPSEEGVAASEERVAESEERVAASEERVAPSEERVEPSEERVEPYEERVEPSSEERVEPYEERVEPSEEKIAPSEERVEPSEEKIAPSEEKVAPFEEKVGPSEQKVTTLEEKIATLEEQQLKSNVPSSEERIITPEKVAIAKLETKDVSETSTKLINPKKRFVKSFEDFEQQWNIEQKRLSVSDEQPSNSEPTKILESEDQVSTEQSKSAQLEQVLIDQEEEQVEPEKEPERQFTGLVEVSKLKTQLMSKLENAERLQPFEQTRHKRFDSPRQSRSLRERILEKQKEEKTVEELTENLLTDMSSSSKSNTAQFTYPVKKESELIKLKSLRVTKVNTINEMEKGNQVNLTFSKDETSPKHTDRSAFIYETQNDVISDIKETFKMFPLKKPRRLSVKIPEVKETLEAEQSGELSELNETELITEQAHIMEVEQDSEVLQVQQVVTETSSIELQPSYENQTNLTLSHDDEVSNEKIEDSIPTLNEHHASDNIYKEVDINCENQQTAHEINLDLKENSIILEREDDASKKHISPVELDIKHSEILQFSEAGANKDMDDLISLQFNNEHDSVKNVDPEIDSQNIQQYTTTPINFSHTLVENQNTTIQIDNKESEDLSALSTLAAVSELTTNLDIEHRSSADDKSKIIEGNLATTVSEIPTSLHVNAGSSDKSKAAEGNLTFVTEDDLADGQVEIANVSVPINQNKPKPMTLSSFSVDFAEPTQTASNDAVHETTMETLPLTNKNIISRTSKRKHSADLEKSEIIERSLEKVFEGDSYGVVPNTQYSKSPKLGNTSEKIDSDKIDIEAQIPSLIVCTSKSSDVKSMLPKKSYLEKMSDPPEYTSSSKLLEILTDGKPKVTPSEIQKLPVFDATQFNRKIDPKPSLLSTSGTITSTNKNISKFDPKNSKFIIKSAISKANISIPVSKSNSKPIILSEKIIKPVSETESVSVQKVTSKRIYQDIEDIDAFIIQKPAKKLMVSQDNDTSENIPVVSQPVKKTVTPRGKAKILQQTIIKPAGEVMQPIATTLSATTTSQPIDDNMFDINSMPIVLGDQILTAESIENMPVVLSESLQTTSKNVTSTTTIVSKPQSEQIKLLNKSSPSVTTQPVLVKTYPSQKLAKGPRIYPSGTTKIVKSNPAIITRTGKSDKFIIVPPGSSNTTSTSKYTVGKRPPIMKRTSPAILPTPPPATKVKTASSSEPTRHKIMIVTNQQGHQSRVILTPADQEQLLGYQSSGSKLVKNTLKGNILQKVSNIKTSNISSLTNVGPSKVTSMISHAIVNSKGEIISAAPSQNLITTSDGQLLMSVKSPPVRGIRTEAPKSGRKIQMQSQKVLLQEGLNALKNSPIPGQQKTIVIKNQQGQIVKKFQGTDDALLEQQVAEQVQAIKASGSFNAMKSKQEISTSKLKPTIRRSYAKKTPTMDTIRSTSKPQMVLNTANVTFTSPKLQKNEASVPPLAPISPPKKPDTLLLTQQVPKMDEVKMDTSVKEASKAEHMQKPLNQLIIQDALGNQTTITEGQILALPTGETVDGQTQSYMLVSLDESGNLAPLNNEALLSLDPNLCLGGDLGSMVLQVDNGAGTAKQDTNDIPKNSSETNINKMVLSEVPASQNNEIIQREKQPSKIDIPVPVQEQITEDKSSIPENVSITNSSTLLTDSIETSQQSLENVQTVTCSIGSDPNQQLIITGDPISTQKFIESLAEGNPEIANLLAGAEGNILIQTDEQHILINTDAENPMLLPVNAAENLGVMESSESSSNPIFAAQPSKNQDILAAALADTDVFQQEQTASPAQAKMIPQSQLSPSTGLYPSGVANVLGTTLTLSSPIMTPLEIPSSNNKKIPDEESDILTTEIPKNVDLPITITDPNISQTVAQQQVASLMASELTSNLELPLAISDHGVPLTSAEMNSPTYVYSLPSLDETVDIHPKTFSGPISMPLLTEEPQETSVSESISSDIDSKTEIVEKTAEDKETLSSVSDVDTSLQLSSVSKSDSLFETSALPTNDSIKERLQTNRTFLGTTIETEEGLCTLGGAMCSSLSEPPPDMFDLSIVNSGFGPDPEIKEHIDSNIPESDIVSNVSETSTSCQSKPIDCDMNLSANEQTTSMEEDYNKYDNYDNDCRNDGTPLSSIPLNSESSSPAVNIDENSCEIPVQPQIVTDLSSSSFETHETTDSADFDSNKRISSDDSIENEKKKSKFD